MCFGGSKPEAPKSIPAAVNADATARRVRTESRARRGFAATQVGESSAAVGSRIQTTALGARKDLLGQ